MSPSPPLGVPRASCILLVCLSFLLTQLVASPVVLAEGTWSWPAAGELLTTYRNGDDPYAAGQHRGIDIGAPVGSSVRAATGGTVTFAGTAGSSGMTVAVRTEDGRFDTAYLHLDSIAVGEGDVVEQGKELGTVGESGQRSIEAPHVHFGVRDAGERHAYRDPLLFLGAPGTPDPQPPAGPVPAPVKPRPIPAPAPGSAPVPRPAPRPALPRRVPVPRPSSAPRAAALPAPKGAPAAKPLPHPGPAPRPDPGGAPRPTPLPRREVGPRSAPSPAREPVMERSPRPGFQAPQPAAGPPAPGRTPEVVPHRPHAAPADGFDIGWALACTGLIGAAAVALGPRALRRHRAPAASGPRAAAARPVGDRS